MFFFVNMTQIIIGFKCSTSVPCQDFCIFLGNVVLIIVQVKIFLMLFAIINCIRVGQLFAVHLRVSRMQEKHNKLC